MRNALIKLALGAVFSLGLVSQAAAVAMVTVSNVRIEKPGPTMTEIVQLDLGGDFFADPTVTASGSMATLNEDPVLGFVVLVNDPSFGDPTIITPGPGVSLQFDYDFTAMPGAEFGAFVFDEFFDTFGLEFFATSTSQGSVSFDLSGRNLPSVLGLQFQLSTLPGTIPEPATWALLALGLGAIGARRRRAR